MKNLFKTFGIIAIAAIIGISMTGCPPEEEDPGPENDPNTPAGTLVPGNTLAEKLAWVLDEKNVKDGETYTITVTADEAINRQTLSYTNVSNITINLYGGKEERVISSAQYGDLFTVGNGVTLVLDNNITLQGKSDNSSQFVRINSGGTLEMKAGSKITGNKASSSLWVYGGGVYVGENATFIMSGGEISGNSVTTTSFTDGLGGGVYVYNNGTFRIVNGTVYGSDAAANLANTAKTSGDALYKGSTGIAQHGTFSGETWNSKGDLSTTNDTIKVVNGELQ